MKTVFVAGLYSRNAKGQPANVFELMENIERGKDVCIYLAHKGFAPFCPWLDYQYLLHKNPLNELQLKNVSLAWLEVSDVLLVISGAGLGTGVDAEIKRAKEWCIPIYYSAAALVRCET